MTASVSLFGFGLLRNSAQAFVCKNKGLLLFSCKYRFAAFIPSFKHSTAVSFFQPV